MARLAKKKPCPFCGSEDLFVECMDYGEFAVRCNQCLGTGPIGEGEGCDMTMDNYLGERNAIRAWNKRRRRISAPKGGRVDG